MADKKKDTTNKVEEPKVEETKDVIYKITLTTGGKDAKVREDFTGTKWGLVWIRGSAATTDKFLAERLGRKPKYKTKEITKAEAAKLGFYTE